MAFLEIIFYAINLAIGYDVLKTNDVGGSIFIHSFGAYFGLACSYFLSSKASLNHPANKSSYNSNLIAMIGSLFLFIYWPSFNGVLATLANPNAAARAIINTVLSLSCSCLATFALSKKLNNGKFEMEDLLNATLAGGVIIGASADILYSPF